MKRRPDYIFEIARKLRKRMTPAEKLLWTELRNRKLSGLKFLRQHPIRRYVGDFYCKDLRLIVELEGEIHDDPIQKKFDDARFDELDSYKYQILRIRNEEVFEDLRGVLRKILSFQV